MKKIILIAALSIAGICFFAGKAQSQIVYNWGGEYMCTVVDLPNDERSYLEEYDSYANVGYIYKQLWVLWVPMWNWDGRYCLVVEGVENTYYPLTDENRQLLEELYTKEELDLDKLPGNPIPFWDKIGGKLIWLAVIAFFIWNPVKKAKKKDEDEDEGQPETENDPMS